MIARISNGAKVSGLANYLHGPGWENEHAYGLEEGGQVIGGNLMVEGDRDGHRWARDMHEAQRLRPDIERPVWHMSLRAAPEDPRLSDAQWADIAQRHGEAMGWDAHPWVVVRHADDHVHVVVSRVDFEGQVWSTSNDRYKARSASMEAEKIYQLRPTRMNAPSPVRTAKLTQGEFAKAERTATPPLRTRTADLVRAARDHAQRTGGGRAVFEIALSENGVQWRANIASTGRMNGYSFHVPGHLDAGGKPLWWKASDLDRSLSWGKLSKVLEPRPVKVHVPLVERRRFERASTYEHRVAEATDHARAKFAEQSARKMGQQVRDNSLGSRMFWRSRATQRAKKTEQWVRNIETRAVKRAEIAETTKLLRAGFPQDRTARRATTAKLPTSPTFRAGVKAVDYAARIARAATVDEPRRGRGLGR